MIAVTAIQGIDWVKGKASCSPPQHHLDVKLIIYSKSDLLLEWHSLLS